MSWSPTTSLSESFDWDAEEEEEDGGDANSVAIWIMIRFDLILMILAAKKLNMRASKCFEQSTQMAANF